MFKRFCKGNEGKIVFAHAACGNSDLAHDHACMHKYVKSSKNSLSLVEELRIPGACCAYNDFEGC